jgi:ribosome maturation factor RimP
MINPSVQHQIEVICARLPTVAEFADIEVLKCAVHREHRVFHVSVTIDREGGADSDLCEAVSRHIENRIDALPPPVPLFTLEVASAGLERPLLKPEHYRRFLGRPIKVLTTLRIKNRTEFTGEIASADENAVTLNDKYAGVTPLPYAAIKRAHLVYDPRTDLSRKS